MKLYFLKEFIGPILSAEKTQTTRTRLSKNIQKHSTVKAVAKSREFAELRVEEVEHRKLGTFDNDDAQREGFSSLDEFIKIWKKLYRSFDADKLVYVVRFRLIE